MNTNGNCQEERPEHTGEQRARAEGGVSGRAHSAGASAGGMHGREQVGREARRRCQGLQMVRCLVLEGLQARSPSAGAMSWMRSRSYSVPGHALLGEAEDKSQGGLSQEGPGPRRKDGGARGCEGLLWPRPGDGEAATPHCAQGPEGRRAAGPRPQRQRWGQRTDWSQQVDVHRVAVAATGMTQWPGPRMLPTTCSGRSLSLPQPRAEGNAAH